MKQQYEQVREFMRAMNQETPGQRVMPEFKTAHARFWMLEQECHELIDSKVYTDYVDAVVDILYLTLGAAVEAGLDADTLTKCFSEVHRANMSKFWTLDQVFENKNKLITVERAVDDRWIAKQDGKVVKPPTFTSPNLSAILSK